MSSHHYRLLTVLFLIASIFGLGAIAVKMEYSGMDSTTLMAYVGGVALAGVILYGFRHPIWAGLRRLGGVYERLEGGDYAALPEGHTMTMTRSGTRRRATNRRTASCLPCPWHQTARFRFSRRSRMSCSWSIRPPAAGAGRSRCARHSNCWLSATSHFCSSP